MQVIAVDTFKETFYRTQSYRADFWQISFAGTNGKLFECFVKFHFLCCLLCLILLFPPVNTLLGTSAPTQSLMPPLSSAFQAPPPHSPFPLSSSRRRFTVSGAASGDSLPICHRHRRGILVHFLNHIPKNHMERFFEDCLHFDIVWG